MDANLNYLLSFIVQYKSGVLLRLSIFVSTHLVAIFLLMFFCLLLLKDSLLAVLIDVILLIPLSFLGMSFETSLGCEFPIVTSFLIAMVDRFFRI